MPRPRLGQADVAPLRKPALLGYFTQPLQKRVSAVSQLFFCPLLTGSEAPRFAMGSQPSPSKPFHPHTHSIIDALPCSVDDLRPRGAFQDNRSLTCHSRFRGNDITECGVGIVMQHLPKWMLLANSSHSSQEAKAVCCFRIFGPSSFVFQPPRRFRQQHPDWGQWE